MQIVAVKVKVYLLEDIRQEYAAAAIANLVDKALCLDAIWEQYHHRNCFKSYGFSGLAPVEKAGTYQRDTLRTFTLRTLDMKLAEYLCNILPHMEISEMKGLTAETWHIPHKPIEKLYSLTPVVIKSQNSGGYWRGANMSPADFQNRIFVNLVKKYNFFQETRLREDFCLWNQFTLLNKKPIPVPYKNITLLGDKIELQVDSSRAAQDLAYMALATGLGELSSRGIGYVNYKPLKEV